MLEQIISGFVGGLGGILSTFAAEWKNDREHKRAMEIAKFNADQKRVDADIRQEEMKLAFAENVRDHDREIVMKNWEGLDKSLKHDAELKASTPWIEDLRALMRPGITIGCLAFSGVGFLNGYQPTDMLQMITTMSVFWWFGARSIERSSVKIFERSDWKRAR